MISKWLPSINLVRRPAHVALRLFSSSQSGDETDLFKDMPEVGNPILTNPYRHSQALAQYTPRTTNSCRLHVAILGIPNSGKSTLVNKLMGREVCAWSSKHNTTRTNARAVLVEGETQVVFLDTPGVVDTQTAKKFKLEDSLLRDPEKSCLEADLLVVLHDVSNRYIREAIDPKILKLLCLYQHRVPAILVLNKMDTIPKSRRIFDLIRKLTCNRLEMEEGGVKISQRDSKFSIESYLKRKERSMHKKDEIVDDSSVPAKRKMTLSEIVEKARRETITEDMAEDLIQGLLGWPGFRDVFTISAKEGDGVEDVKKYLIDSAKPGRWRYGRDIVTDVDPRAVVVRLVKSKLLEHLPHQIPYSLHPEVEVWQVDPDTETLMISTSVVAKNRKEAGLIIGFNGSKNKQISSEVEVALADLLGTEVKFCLQVIVPESKEDSRPEPIPKTIKSDAFL